MSDSTPSTPGRAAASSRRQIGAGLRGLADAFVGLSVAERLLLGFLLLRLSLALLTAAHPDGAILTDSRGYLGLMRRLLENGSYSWPDNPEPDLLRPPAYPVFLLALHFVFGPSLAYVSLVQLAISGWTSWLLVVLGRELERREVGLVAAWIFALSPNLGLWSLTVMTEVLLAFALTLALLLIVRSTRARDGRWPAWSGVILGLASYVRPITVVLLPVWGGAAYLAFREKGSPDRGLRAAALIGILAFGLMLPWAIRNWWVHNQLLFSTVTEKTWVGFNLAAVVAEAQGLTRDAAVAQLDPSEGMLALTWRVIRTYPGIFIRSQILGVARSLVGLDLGTWGYLLNDKTWVGLGLLSGAIYGDYLDPIGALSRALEAPAAKLRLTILALSLAYSFALLGLAAAGAWVWRTAEGIDRFVIAFAALTVLMLVLTPGAAGQARFRVPAEPYLSILAGYGWAALGRWRMSRERQLLEHPAAEDGALR